MPKYNGKSYVVKLVRANKSHKCAATGAPINSGDYYCHLTVDDGKPLRRGRHGSSYHEHTILRLHLGVLATVEFEDILESLEVFRNNDAYIKKLKETNQELSYNLDMCLSHKHELEHKIEALKRQLNNMCDDTLFKKACTTGTEIHDLIEEAMEIYEKLPKLTKYGYSYEKNFIRLQEIKRELKNKYNTILHGVNYDYIR